MTEETLEVGPFTPQEIEEVCEKLKAQGTSFEILKDEAQEKAEMKENYHNVVMKAEYRLEPYLGQIFYLRMKTADFNRNKALFDTYGMAVTQEEKPQELEADVTEVVKDSQEQKRLQRVVARGLAALLFCALLYYVVKLILPLFFK